MQSQKAKLLWVPSHYIVEWRHVEWIHEGWRYVGWINVELRQR
jgi:hypothetical protein